MLKLRTISSHPWILVLPVAMFWGAIASGQEESPPSRRPMPFPNSFGKFVNPSGPPPRMVETKPTREPKGLGGLFMPLKSFSNAFRSDSQDLSDDASAEISRRPTREPFQGSSTDKSSTNEIAPPQIPHDEPINRAKVSFAPKPQTAPQIASTNQPVSESAPTDETHTATEPKTYSANPKTDSLDPKGTSRRTKNPSVNAAIEKSARSGRVEQRISGESTNGEQKPWSAVPKSNKSNDSKSIDAASPASPAHASSTTPAITPVSRSTRSIRSSQSNDGVDFHIPGLHLKIVGPDSILIGKAVPYELIASNEGRTDLNGLTARILLPESVTIEEPSTSSGTVQATGEGSLKGLTWQVNQIPSGASRSLKIMIRTQQPEHFALSLDWKIEGTAVEQPVRVQQPQLILALEGPSEADFGRPQTFRLRVRNPGNATAEKVRVQLRAEPNGSSEELLGDLLPGTERILEVELTFQQPGKLPVFATAVSEASNVEASRTIDVDVHQSQLIANWTGPDEYYQGNTADYLLTLENQGSIDALDNECHVEFPTGMELISLPSGVTRNGTTLRWTVPKLAVGESSKWEFQFAMNQSGQNRLVFKANSSTGEANPCEIQTKVDAVADLALSVDDPISPAPVGKPVVYQITVTNRGKKVAEDVFVIAQFSEGIEPTKIEGHAGKLVPGQALFDTISKIEPGQEIKLRITAEASKPGSHRFRAAVRCQGSEDDLLKEESTRYAASGTGPTSQK